MKSEEVVALLQANLPALNSSFSNNVSITSLVNTSGIIATADTATPHGLSAGDLVLVSGAQSNISITSLTRSGTIGTLVTATNHDITNGLLIIEIDGANEGEFNGSFNIVNVDNRKTIRFSMPDSGATVATGSPELVDGESPFRGYNGLQTVTTVPTTTQFTYNLQGSGLLPATGTIIGSNGIRISAGGNIERLIDAYTKQSVSDNWLFVVLNDVNASKSRHILSDGVDNLNRGAQGEGFRQQIIQSLTIYSFIPTSDKLTAREARDESEDLFENICQSVLFYKFDSNLAAGRTNGSLIFTGHGMFAYNSAFYVHQFSFEQMVDLTFLDTVGYDVDTAFRDIDLIMNQTTGNETFTAAIDLDDVQL